MLKHKLYKYVTKLKNFPIQFSLLDHFLRAKKRANKFKKNRASIHKFSFCPIQSVHSGNHWNLPSPRFSFSRPRRIHSSSRDPRQKGSRCRNRTPTSPRYRPLRRSRPRHRRLDLANSRRTKKIPRSSANSCPWTRFKGPWPCPPPTYFQFCRCTDCCTAPFTTLKIRWADTTTLIPGIRARKPSLDRWTGRRGVLTAISIRMGFYNRSITWPIIMDSGSWPPICRKPSNKSTGNDLIRSSAEVAFYSEGIFISSYLFFSIFFLDQIEHSPLKFYTLEVLYFFKKGVI